MNETKENMTLKGFTFPKPPDRYCNHCGSKVNYTFDVIYQKQEYDEVTGDLTTNFIIYASCNCPNNRHWWDKHTYASAFYNSRYKKWHGYINE